MKKTISFATLFFIGIAALISIFSIFNILNFKGWVVDLLLTSLTFTFAGILILNSFLLIERKNKLGLVSIFLILLSAISVTIYYWTSIKFSSVYMKSTLIVCILSICFNMIISNVIKLQSDYITVQILSYFCFVIASLLLILAIFNVKLFLKLITIFILFIILSFTGLCTLSVLSKKQPVLETSEKSYVKISKKEYQELLECKKQLEELRG